MKIRTYLALVAGKITSLALKILGRKIPYYPGYIALRVDSKFLKNIKKPDLIIGVTGTNGKTTTTSILTEIFKNKGFRVLTNNGFNIETGFAAAFIKKTSIFGKLKADVAILEIDEKQSGELFKACVPDYLICTKLSRDSMRDNGNIDYILSKLKRHLPEQTKLILNADDLIVCELGENKENIYFGLDKLSTDKKQINQIVCDLVYCPDCGAKLKFKNIKYNHVGKINCSKCHFTNPTPNYLGKLNNNKLIVNENKNQTEYPLIQSSIFNVYNQMAIIAILRELDYSETEVAATFTSLSIPNSRYAEDIEGQIRIISQMVKGQNPVACSTGFNYVKNNPGSKIIVLFLDDIMDAKNSVETVAWYYDVDFEYLNDEEIKQIIVVGARRFDVNVRLLLAGIPSEKILLTENESNIITNLNLEKKEAIFLLYDILMVDQIALFREELKKYIRSLLK